MNVHHRVEARIVVFGLERDKRSAFMQGGAWETPKLLLCSADPKDDVVTPVSGVSETNRGSMVVTGMPIQTPLRD